MTTATAVAAPNLESLQQEISTLESEIKSLKEKRAVEEKTLASLEGQQQQISESVARGESKRSAASDLNQKLDACRAALQGFDGLLREPTKKLDDKYHLLRKLEVETRRAAEIAEVEDLQAEGALLVESITRTLASAMNRDLAKYQDVRKKLGQIASRASLNTFPIPAASQSASTARKQLDKSLSDQLEPFLKAFR